MKLTILVFAVFSFVSNEKNQKRYPLADLVNGLPRVKRETVGALHILTNHAQPIHADVKQDNTIDSNDKPCTAASLPGHVETGVVFQVTAPEDAVYEVKSLRKSLPLHQPPSTFDLVRSINRLATLTVLIITAVFEFYPILQSVVEIIQIFLA